jgi:site-specific DNA-adenine methylase
LNIIEPFCGAAQFSLYGNNWENNVVLYDKDKTIIDVWTYLIRASKEDILSLPDMFAGDSVNDHKQLTQAERSLIGYCINPGSASPKITARATGNWSLPQANRASLWNRYKKDIAENLYKIRHWVAEYKDYRDIDFNLHATWFIDPPYMHGGKYYRMSSTKINYWDLGEWCKSRNGQVIVCENTKADWLDFKPLVEMNGQLHKTTEAIWYKEE